MYEFNGKLQKMSILLSYFEKLSVLTPSRIEYLLEYQKRQTNPILKEKIGELLKKPNIKDPIFNYDYSIDYSKYGKKKIEIKSEKQIEKKQKINLIKKIISLILYLKKLITSCFSRSK